MINRAVLYEARLLQEQLFVDRHPNSAQAATAASKSLLAGVPMSWMKRWPGKFPLSVSEAKGGRFVDIDGHEYVDFCLGDTGAMTGHGVTEIADAISAQMYKGATMMLPTTDATWVGEELTRRFGLPKWQFALSATDANRFVLRLARQITGRPKVLVHDWCYHGSVDETLVIADENGQTVSRPGAIGPQVHPSLTTRVVPFNDLAKLEEQLQHLDVACYEYRNRSPRRWISCWCA